jgi:hypothetical protein
VFDRLCNCINDWDLTWVGFRAFRPTPDQDMTPRVVLALCIVYCPLSAMIAFAIAYIVLRRQEMPAAPWIIAACAAVAFFLMQRMLAGAWNRRAARMRADGTTRTPMA